MRKGRKFGMVGYEHTSMWILENFYKINGIVVGVVMTKIRAITNVVIWDEFHYFFYATHMSCCNTPCEYEHIVKKNIVLFLMATLRYENFFFRGLIFFERGWKLYLAIFQKCPFLFKNHIRKTHTKIFLLCKVISVPWYEQAMCQFPSQRGL